MALGIFFLAGCGQTQTSQTQSTAPAIVPTQTPPVANTQTTQAVQTQQSQEGNIYKNATYNFQLTMPKSWSNYKIRTEQIAGHKLISISIPAAGLSKAQIATTDKGYCDVIGIDVFTTNEWNKLLANCQKNNPEDPMLCADRNNIIGQNAKYVFTGKLAPGMGSGCEQFYDNPQTFGNYDVTAFKSSFKLISQ